MHVVKLHTLGNGVKLAEVELDCLGPDGQLQSPEAQQELRQQEGQEEDPGRSLQREDDGVDVGQEVDGERGLEQSQQPEPGQLGHLGG